MRFRRRKSLFFRFDTSEPPVDWATGNVLVGAAGRAAEGVVLTKKQGEMVGDVHLSEPSTIPDRILLTGI